MEVSHFELLFKPQAPVGPGGGAAPVDTALQGYFLEISNLEAATLRFRLEFVAVPPAAGQANRSLAGNTLVFIDTPGVDNDPGVLSGGFGSTVFTPSQGLIVVPPRTTALVAVLPSVFGPTPVDPTPIPAADFEVRGYVRITLPALLAFENGVFTFVPQSAGPVRVLLTPQNRTTFLGAGGAIADQTQASLPTAAGAALYAVPPQQSLLAVAGLRIDQPALNIADSVPEEFRPGLLAALMAQVGDGADLAGFNRALADMDVPLALERRAGKAAKPSRQRAAEDA